MCRGQLGAEGEQTSIKYGLHATWFLGSVGTSSLPGRALSAVQSRSTRITLPLGTLLHNRNAFNQWLRFYSTYA